MYYVNSLRTITLKHLGDLAEIDKELEAYNREKQEAGGAIPPGFRHSVALWRLLRRRWCCFTTAAKNAHRPVKREKGATPSGGSPFYVMRKNMALLANHRHSTSDGGPVSCFIPGLLRRGGRPCHLAPRLSLGCLPVHHLTLHYPIMGLTIGVPFADAKCLKSSKI